MATARGRSSGRSCHSRTEAPPSEWITRSLHSRACASLGRGDPGDNQSAFDRGRGQPRPRSEGWRTRFGLLATGGDCYAYCALAAGFIHLVIETGLKPHDIVALAPIIEGAGGINNHLGGGKRLRRAAGSSRRAIGRSMIRPGACCSGDRLGRRKPIYRPWSSEPARFL